MPCRARIDVDAAAGIGANDANLLPLDVIGSTEVSGHRLRQLLEELNASVLPAAGEASIWWTVFDWIEKYADHEPDWADGCIAALCGRDRTLKVWTYDKESSARPGAGRPARP